MRHAREDYNRIQDPAGLIPEDEPVFLIRGKDAAGPEAVRAWASRAKALGAGQQIVDLAFGWAREMEAYQTTHSAQVPDLPADNADLEALDAAPAPAAPSAEALVPYGLLAERDIAILRVTDSGRQFLLIDLNLREGAELEMIRATQALLEQLLRFPGSPPMFDIKAAPR